MIWAYLAGIATIPVGGIVIGSVALALERNIGSGGCTICGHYPWRDIGEQYRITSNFRDWWHTHRWAKRKWHRDILIARNEAARAAGKQYRTGLLSYK